MSLDHNYINRNGTVTGVSKDPENTFIGRVVDIILDNTHPDYEKYGYSDSIGMIKYTTLGTRDDGVESEGDYAGPAVPISKNSMLYPLKNEVVLLTRGPSFSVENQAPKGKMYYQTVFSLHNHIHHNALPETTGSKQADIGDGIDEQSNIAPLQPLPGDHIIEGRLGQSLRFSGG